MTPDDIRKDGERTKKFVVWFAWISIAAIAAFGFAVKYHLSWQDLVEYAITIPFVVLTSPALWVPVGMFGALWALGKIWDGIERAWRTHRDQQRRIIELLEKQQRRNND